MPREKTDLVVFTGAGASKPLGYPLTNEFFAGEGETAIYRWLKGTHNTEQLDVEIALNTLKEVQRFSSSDAGRFLAYLANPYQLAPLFQSVDEYIQRVEDMCFDKYGDTPDQNEVEKLYGPLLDRVLRVQERRVDFFTTNYDPVSDAVLVLMRTLQIPATEGFDKLGDWMPREFDDNTFRFRLFRLHGSMCYHKDRKTGRITNARSYNRVGGPANKRPGHIMIYPGDKVNPVNDISNELLWYPHTNLKESLMQASLVVVVGFAFRDSYINEAFLNAYKNNDSFRLVVINPAPIESIKRNMPAEMENFTYIPFGFGDEAVLQPLLDSM